MTKIPIFVRSGDIFLPNTTGTLRSAGIHGYWWSSRGDAATNAYSLHFNASGVYQSNGPLNRYIGFPLRCLSTVLGMGGVLNCVRIYILSCKF